jgi:NitT/TauT family transport system substrate-binding protein
MRYTSAWNIVFSREILLSAIFDRQIEHEMISRRQFIATLGGLTLAQALPGCGWSTDKPITIAAHIWPGYEPMFLARSQGWLDEKQAHLLETKSATESLQALTDGKVDGAALTLDETLGARAAGLSLSVVMVFDISAGADMLLARPNIKKLADIRGQRIGYEQGAEGELMLDQALLAAGLTKQDIRLVPLNTDKYLDAWNRNQVDAVITYEPVASQLLAQGALMLFNSAQIPNMIVDVLAIRSDVLDRSHASAIRHLMSAHFRSLNQVKRNPHDAAYRMAAHLGLPATGVLNAFKGLVLPDVANNHRLLGGASPELLVSARKLSAIMTRSGLLKQEDTLALLINSDFLPVDSLVN